MKMRIAFWLAAIAVMMASCMGSDGVEKTTNGAIIEMPEDMPTRQVKINVFSDKVIGVKALMDVDADDARSWELPEVAGTPFTLDVEDSMAELTTLIEGIRVNRATSEISFVDSVGTVLLNIMPGAVAHSELERVSHDGDFRLIFSQHDSLVVNDSTVVPKIPRIATDGYNILWRANPSSPTEEYYLVFGEAVNNLINQPAKTPKK